jgi:hypothetical protein
MRRCCRALTGELLTSSCGSKGCIDQNSEKSKSLSDRPVMAGNSRCYGCQDGPMIACLPLCHPGPLTQRRRTSTTSQCTAAAFHTPCTATLTGLGGTLQEVSAGWVLDVLLRAARNAMEVSCGHMVSCWHWFTHWVGVVVTECGVECSFRHQKAPEAVQLSPL